MRRPATTMLTLAMLLLGVAACGSGDDSSVDGADLDGRSFVATGVEGQELVPDVEVRLSFADGFLNLSAGCNAINGAYELEDGELTWADEPFGTLIGCEPPLQAQDEWLTALITDGAEVDLDGASLTLTGGDTTLELEEAEPIDADEAGAAPTIEGTVWLLTATDDGETVSERPGGVQAPTFQVQDGEVVVFTGCNNGGTAVEVGEQTLTLEPLEVTEVACPGETAEVEAAQLAVLEGEVDYAIEDTTLTLTKGDRRLVYEAGGTPLPE